MKEHSAQRQVRRRARVSSEVVRKGNRDEPKALVVRMFRNPHFNVSQFDKSNRQQAIEDIRSHELSRIQETGFEAEDA